MLRIEVLMAALLVSSPTLYEALVTGNTPVDTALIRFLIAVPVCGLGLSFVRKVFGAYAAQVPAAAGHGEVDAAASSASASSATAASSSATAAASAAAMGTPNRRRDDAPGELADAS